MDAVLKQQEMLCAEKHKNIDARLDGHDQTLQSHEQRLDNLEQGAVRTETIVKNLCSQLKSLTTAIWWFFGLLLTTAIGFVIWYIQSLPN